MFKKFFKFLRGYVIIKISGRGAERFLNICLRRGIEVWNTNPLKNGIELSIAKSDFHRIRAVARKCGVSVKIKEKHGLFRLIALYKNRYIFVIAAAVCIIAFAVLSQFIWLVEINGVENSDIESITAVLDDIGVKRGALKKSLPEGMEMKRAIVSNSDSIAWAWVYVEGVKARVEIYEQTLPPNVIDKDTPCDVVSSCDGVIKHLTVKNGEEKVREGDAVRAGDIIVSGKVAAYKEGYQEEYIYVHSMASAEAYTTHRKSGEYKTYYESRTPTGKRKIRYSAEFMGKIFSLPAKKIPYEEYDVFEKRHELYIPFFGYTGIALCEVRADEVTVRREPLSVQTTVEFAKNDLEEKISGELMAGSVLEDENIEYDIKDNETINVTLEMNFTENIAVQQPLSQRKEDKGEEIFDKQTDRGAAGD